MTTVDGSPDAEIKILVRGGGSITQDNSPLIILDGFEVSSLNDVPPTDIESIEVLKDAASTAIYGARGANGVILVTTKRPQEGRVVINLNAYMQTKELSKKLDVMDPYEFVLMQYESARQKSSNPTDFNNKYGHAYEHYIYQGNPGTDWQDEVFGSNPVAKSIDLSVNGGTEKIKYKLSFIHQDQPSVMVGNGLKQNNLNASFNFKPYKFLTLEYRTRLLHKEVDGSGTEGVSLLTALRERPTTGLDEYMTLPEDDTYFDPDQLDEVTRFNPIEESEKNYKKRINKSLNTMGAVKWDIIKGMTFRTEFGFENNSEEQRRFWGMGTSNARNNNNQPMAEWSMKQGTKWQLTNVLNYNFTLDDDAHDIRLMLGQEIKHNQTTTKTYSTRFFPENITAEKVFDNLSLGTPYENSSSAASPSRISSFFGRINYSYNDKYLATVTLRADGSSKFAKGNRWGFFPAGALAWRISNEDFLKDNSLISKLKLHTSYGLTGNSEIGTYKSLATVSQSNTIIGDALHVVSYLDNMPNPDLKWEKTGQWDLGFELGLFNNRLNFDISYYYKYTSDLLLDRPVPESTGYSSIMDNIGAVSNRGVDILVTAYPIQTHDFQWTSTLNLGFNKNRVEKLDESASVDPVTGKRQITTDGFVGYDMLIREGEELSSFYGYKRAGIYDGIPSNWDPETMNIPSTIGEKVTYKKREIIGNGLPDWMGSFINTFNYKGFDLTLDFQFTWGVDVMQEYYHSTVARFLTNGIDRLYKEAWHPTLNPSGKEQAIRLNNFGQGANNQADDDWVCNGSYLRCNMIQLGYTFNPTLIKKIGLSSLRLYANVNNAFLITSKDYNGYDPDNSSRLGDNKWGANRQFFTYPRPRTFTFGLNVAF